MRKLENVTVTLDPETASWARIEAARRNTSVSRMLGEILAREMRGDGAYSQAMKRYLGQEPGAHPMAGPFRPSRAELHDRERLR